MRYSDIIPKMPNFNPDTATGNRILNELFRQDSSLQKKTKEDENGLGDSRFNDFALLANLASLHDSPFKNLTELTTALKAELIGGPETGIFEDQAPSHFGVSNSALLYILDEMEKGRGDAALKQVLKAPRSVKFDSGQPVLSPAQRMNRLTSPSELKLNGGLPLAIQPKPQNELIPLTLSRNSRQIGQSLADALHENLSPVLSRVDPKLALKTTERLATIEKVTESVRPHLEKLTEAVSVSQGKQIGTFMESIERTIAAAAAGLKNIVGIEITDYSGNHLTKTDQRQETKFLLANGTQNEASRSALSHNDRIDEKLRIHRERPMADGEVAVDVKPFTAHTRTTHFAASSAPLGKQAHVEHHTTDSGAYASATGQAVCASSATVVESNFRSDGIKVTFSVRK